MRVYLGKWGVNSKSLEFFFSRPAESFRTRLVLDAPYFLLDASHYSIIPHYSSSHYRDIDKKNDSGIFGNVFRNTYLGIYVWYYGIPMYYGSTIMENAKHKWVLEKKR